MEQQQAIQIARSAVERFAAALPGGVLAGYLIGSAADGALVALSDIDLIILLARPPADDAERAALAALTAACAASSPVRLDIVPVAAEALPALPAVLRVALARDSLHIWGAELGEQLRLPPLDAYTRSVTEGAWLFLAGILRGLEQVVLPLAAPDPSGALLGYDRVRVAAWYPEGVKRGTKELVATASRLATALLALEQGQYVGSKGGAVRAFAAAGGADWADLPLALYQRCKLDWGYQPPATAGELAELRALCERMLAFEQHYLTVYRGYLAALGDQTMRIAEA